MNNVHKLVEKAIQRKPPFGPFGPVDLATIFCALNLEILKILTRLEALEEKTKGLPRPKP